MIIWGNGIIKQFPKLKHEVISQLFLRTDIGIENQIKLAEMKRAGKLTKPDKSLLELFRIFTPFRAQ